MKFDNEREDQKEQLAVDNEKDVDKKAKLVKEQTNKTEEKKKVIESLVAKIERQLYYNVINSVPREQGYLLSFFLGLIQHLDLIEASNR